MYKIIGTDGKEYGPISAEQIRLWISENRVERQTPVFADGAKDWNFLGLLPEFAGYFPGAAPVTPPVIAAPGQPRKTNGFATAGLVCGILSLMCCCGFPFNLFGIVFSLVGLSQINADPQRQEGRGIAIAGLILSAVSFILGFGLILLNLALHPSNLTWQFKHS
jgi:Domain of unknown function (DUF4190)/GYF domain 2